MAGELVTDDKTHTVDQHWMQHALALAVQAEALGEVPVGAVVVDGNGCVVGEGWNQPISGCDPTAHAEIVALRGAALKTGNYRLPGCTLYVTIEPCTMCVGALIHARIARLVFGATEPKAGSVVSQARLLDSPVYNHGIAFVGGVCAEQAGALLSAFFQNKRTARPVNK